MSKEQSLEDKDKALHIGSVSVSLRDFLAGQAINGSSY